ncbi:DUF1996 domain-containing protein [Actinophytocola sp.]|uniref:DUF1996 domain-containing protein n=1 Tax=Actinophytocola sp. TaxID=1872138 RepID=UPI002D7EF79D|nr:DUF1996 domain-containing protein [Actinophytocola sp.]HET9140514.1 DUF1996 domain-containing protein [Actinophytocola sp.]
MARHQMPQRTKRRLIAAGIAAVTIIGTGVVIGVTGAASAKNRGNSVDLSVLECIPDVANPTSSATAPPPPASSAPGSSAVAPPASSAEQAPPAEAPAEQPAEEAPAEQPAEQAPAEQPAAEAPAENPATPAVQGFRKPPVGQPAQPEAAVQPEAPAQPEEQAPAEQVPGAPAGQPAQPPSETPGKPAPPAAPNGGANTAPDEAGAPAPMVPAPQPQAEDVKEFTKQSCSKAFGPFPQDFVNILKVRPSNLYPRVQRSGSRGTFTSRCGTNANGHRNSDNHIAAPGVVNGAHHQHDYVGNEDTDNQSTPESLSAAGTTCTNGDKSTYFWPVIRVRDRDGGGAGDDAPNPHNIGEIIAPASANLTFHGNPVSKVVAMPQFIKVLTGNAKAAIQNGANANAKWTCSGFQNRFTDKYPLCPRGSRLMRVADFPSCWDGQNVDSANHRTHIVFPDKTGACPAGTKAVPQLRITLTYNLPRGRIFAVDAFPEVQHNPTTDHNDFQNVMPEALMNQAVTCINSGRRC